MESPSDAVRVAAPRLPEELDAVRSIHDAILEVRYDDAFYNLVRTDAACFVLAAYVFVPAATAGAAAGSSGSGSWTMVGVITARKQPAAEASDELSLTSVTAAITGPLTYLFGGLMDTLRAAYDWLTTPEEEVEVTPQPITTATAAACTAAGAAATVASVPVPRPPSPGSGSGPDQTPAGDSVRVVSPVDLTGVSAAAAAPACAVDLLAIPRSELDGEGYIMTLAVLPSARRRGIGEALVCAAARRLVEHHRVAVMTLDCVATNAVARRLYTRCGFGVVRRLVAHYHFHGAHHDGLHLAAPTDQVLAMATRAPPLWTSTTGDV